ncbi:MAG TPA: AMP-binding protein [Candidatus Latescibacteria bacterium]|nr:AMP-binding protein [Candidatus Latescibacterota bacterium]
MRLSIVEAARECPTRTALYAEGTRYTFAELSERTQQRMREFTAVLPKSVAGSSVAVIGSNDLETTVSLFALWELEIPALLIHPRAPLAERTRLLEVFQPAASVRGREVHPSGPFARDIPEGTACLILTSGTTGHPKAAVLSHAAFVASAEASATRLQWRSDDRWLVSLSIAHVGGLSIITRCLLARSCVVLHRRFTEDEFVRAVEEDRVTQVSLVPTMLERVLERYPQWRAPGYLRFALIGGGPANPDLTIRAARRGIRTLLSYGLTECCSQVCTQPLDRSDDDPTCGEPLDGFQVETRDSEIWVKGPAMMTGYYPQHGAPVFDKDGWFGTGDAGVLEDGQRLRVLGRLDDAIVTGGEKVHPSEVEAILLTCPNVRAACVFGRQDAVWGQIICAALTPAPGTSVDSEDLRTTCARYLSPSRMPRKYCILDHIPLNRNGKHSRAETARVATPLLRDL